jgi:hypothetical protein
MWLLALGKIGDPLFVNMPFCLLIGPLLWRLLVLFCMRIVHYTRGFVQDEHRHVGSLLV